MNTKFKIITALIFVSLLAVNCSRDIESEGLDYDPPNEPATPIGLTLTLVSEAVQLSWQMADTAVGISFNVYSSDSINGTYDSWEITTEFSSVITGLIIGKVYYFKISAISTDGVEGEPTDIQATPIGILSALINNGSKYTNSRNVAVNFITPTGVNLVQLSENKDFADVVWETYTSSKQFELSAVDGVKFVYSRFQFNNGAISDSANPVSDSIILDTESRIDSVSYSPSGIVLASDSVLTFYVYTSEAEGEASVSMPGLNSYPLYYDEIASIPGNDYYVYSRSYTIPYNLETVNALVAGQFIDAAGNQAPVVYAEEPLSISNPPTAVGLTAVAISSSEIRLTWTDAVDEDFAAYQLYRGLNSSVSNNSDPITIIENKNTKSFKDTGLNDNTTYFYRIYIYDNAGLFAGSAVENVTTLVNAPPDPVTLGGTMVTADGNDMAALSWTQNSDNDFASYRVYYTPFASDTTNFNKASLVGIINSQANTTFTDQLPASPGNYYYTVVVFDEQGESAASNWIVVTK